ncbi:uncharacterized protein [Montipora foliosa]|uniref:uncharacterized protein n=1 Tax=Montipora foliosa TaxID=591990 RepID=UPI0035F161CA
MLLEFCDEKELCVANTWFTKGEKRKVTYSAGENETEIDFVLVGKGNRKFLRDVKVIPGVLKACDEVCGKKKGRRDQGGTWWWNEDVKEAIARKKDAHKEMCKSGTEANKAKYKNMKNRAKKVAAKAMKEAAARELSEHPNKVFKLVKSMKKDEKMLRTDDA